MYQLMIDTPQPGILALRRNATHNYGIVYGLAPEGKFLTNNFTLSAEDKVKLGLAYVYAEIITAYNFSKPQMAKVWREWKVQ